MAMSSKTTLTLFAIRLVLFSCRPALMTTVVFALALFGSGPAQAQTVYVGNSLTITNGAPDGIAKSLVILGEYCPAGPLYSATPSTTLPAGTVKDVKFYGQNYNFTLYALSLVINDPGANEQTFKVVASQSFSNSAASPGIQSNAVSGFSVYGGNLLAFAGTGPYYPQTTNDAINSDATYYNVSGYLPPGGAGSVFTVGTNDDSNASYQYIGDNFGNQGRTYAIGVDVSPAASPAPPKLNLPTTSKVTFQSGTNVYYLLQRSEVLAGVGSSNEWTTVDAQEAPGSLMTMTYQPYAPNSNEFFRVVANNNPPVYFADLQAVRNSALIFTNGLSSSNQLYAVQQLDIAISNVPNLAGIDFTPELQQSVSLWESLTDDQKQLLLANPEAAEQSLVFNINNNHGHFCAVAALAAVVAAVVVVEVITAISDVVAATTGNGVYFVPRQMNSDELEAYINSYQPLDDDSVILTVVGRPGGPVSGGSISGDFQLQVKDADLDY
jgi:hypothetical protein